MAYRGSIHATATATALDGGADAPLPFFGLDGPFADAFGRAWSEGERGGVARSWGAKIGAPATLCRATRGGVRAPGCFG